MGDFNFLDYLNFTVKNLSSSATAQTTLKEIESIRSHQASIATMQKHIKQYQAIKKMILSGIEFNIS